jgi:hypothetical protein
VKSILPILFVLLLSACVPEPLEAECDSCDAGGCTSCDTCDAQECESCRDVVPVDTLPCPGLDTLDPDVFDVLDVPDVPDLPDCTGAPPACPAEGVCAAGLEAACFDGEWICPLWELPAWEPVEVTCDGLDNDCDGGTDGDLTPPAGTCKTQGVCAGAIQPLCTALGTWDCGYGQVALYEAEETSFCDGQDNDCDGLTDAEEGTPCPCSPGARICTPAEPNVVQVCPPDGSGWLEEPCPMATECMGLGECTQLGVFQVNETISDDQIDATSSRTETGQWVIGWASDGQDGSDLGIVIRKAGVDGALIGGESLGNLSADHDQRAAAISSLPNGRYLIAWESVDQFGGATSVVARTFPDAGPSPYGETLLSTDLAAEATGPAAASAGPVTVVAWEGGDSGDRDVLLRFIEGGTGLPLAGHINLSAGSPGQDRAPVVVPAGEGFAVLWEKGAPLTEIYGRTVDADGTPGAILEVFSKGGDATKGIRAAGTAAHVLVLWEEVGGQSIAGRVYDADLSAAAPAASLPILAPLVGDYAVAADGWGGFVVAWQDDDADPAVIRLRGWDPLDGLAPEAGEVVVTTSDETPLTVTPHLSLAGSPGGKILVLWNAAAPGGNGTSEVFGRFVSIPAPE